jgi:multidrug resistance protein, MATE family
VSTPPTDPGVPGGIREVVRVAWPLIISTGSFTLMQFVDRMFLAWHDAVSIQAALPAGILSFTLVSGFMAMAGYTNTFVAQYHGAGDRRGCSRATAQGVWLSLLSWPLLLALIVPGQWLLRVSGHPPDVLAQELDYFTILMAGGVTVPLGAAASSFFTGRGDTFTNMVATVAGNLVNVGLDYLMIFGHGGFPAMGIRGAAYATVLAGLVPPLLLGARYFGRSLRAGYGTAETWRPDRVLLTRLLRFGLPAGIHLCLDVASFTVFVLLIGRLGGEALAVSNLALSINMLAFMPLIGISVAASTLVGQYQGRGDSATAEKAGWNALRVGLGYMAVVGATYLLLPGVYFGLFARRAESGLDAAALLQTGRWLLVMMAGWGLFDAANLVLAGALKGAGDTRFVMIYSSVMGWGLLVPVQLALSLYVRAGVLLSWGWLTLYIILLSAGFLVRFRGARWKDIRVIEPVGPPAVAREGGERVLLPD